MEEDEINEKDVLLDVYDQLAAIKWVLVGLLVVVTLAAGAWWLTRATDTAQGQAEEMMECVMAGRQNC